MSGTPVPIDVRGVTRTFGHVAAVDDVSLQVAAGELVGLLGPNGAGKTTLLSLVERLRRPDSGTVRLFGQDPAHTGRAVCGWAAPRRRPGFRRRCE